MCTGTHGKLPITHKPCLTCIDVDETKVKPVKECGTEDCPTPKSKDDLCAIKTGYPTCKMLSDEPL